MLRVVILVVLLLVPAFAVAEVYRCQVGGKLVFMDRLCERDSEPLKVAPASGDYDPVAGHAAAQRLAAELERDRKAAEAWQQREDRRVREEAAKPKRETRCEQIARERASAEYWSREFVHPANVHRELDKLKHYKERDFMECGRVF